MSESKMPWDKMRGEALRVVIKELGLKYYGLKREEMIERLKTVEKHGLDAAIATQDDGKEFEVVRSPRSSAKRRRFSEPQLLLQPPETPRRSSRVASGKTVKMRGDSAKEAFDCVLIPPRPSKRFKGKQRASDFVISQPLSGMHAVVGLQRGRQPNPVTPRKVIQQPSDETSAEEDGAEEGQDFMVPLNDEEGETGMDAEEPHSDWDARSETGSRRDFKTYAGRRRSRSLSRGRASIS